MWPKGPKHLVADGITGGKKYNGRSTLKEVEIDICRLKFHLIRDRAFDPTFFPPVVPVAIYILALRAFATKTFYVFLNSGYSFE